MSLRGLWRDRSLQIGVAILIVVAAIWLAIMATSARTPTLDERVAQVASQLQCPGADGLDVASCPSGLAASMRGVIRQQLQSGKSEQQVIAYFVAAYGEGIRQDPPKSGFTLLMWLGPIVMLLVGIFVVARVARRWRALAPVAPTEPDLDALSPADEERLRHLLEAEIGENAPRSLEAR
jgi:cytochrome c-type biogenesis protein CcmH